MSVDPSSGQVHIINILFILCTVLIASVFVGAIHGVSRCNLKTFMA